MEKSKLIDNIYAAIKSAEAEIEKEYDIRTRIMNISFYVGKFHALMDILEDVDMDSWFDIAGETEDSRNKILAFNEKIYSFR